MPRRRDWSMASLIKEISSLPGTAFLDAGDFVIAHDLYLRMFIFSKSSAAMHPAVAGVSFMGSPKTTHDLMGMLFIAVAGRWRRPALAGEFNPADRSLAASPDAA